MGAQAQSRRGTGPDRSVGTELFDVLSNTRRRYAVYAMSGREEVELTQLARQVAAWETDQPESAVTSREHKRVYTSLQQSHVPKLAEAGLVDYDDERSVLQPRPVLDEYEVYLEAVRGREIPWNEFYLGLSGVGLALTAAVWVGAFPFGSVPTVAWMAGITAAFVVSALAHVYQTTVLRGGGETPPEVDTEGDP